jgi:site-specific recombinase XerD
MDHVESEYIFLNKNDKLMAVNSINHFFKTVKEKVGLGEDLTTHCFRHNFISECYTAGVDVKKLQKWVGHTDIGTTLNIYTELSREVIENASEMNEYYGSQTEVKPFRRNNKIS